MADQLKAFRLDPDDNGLIVEAYDDLTPGKAQHNVYRVTAFEHGTHTKLFDIKFQDCPPGKDGLGRTEMNGITEEALVEILLDRMYRWYGKTSPTKCKEHDKATARLEDALLWLKERRRNVQSV